MKAVVSLGILCGLMGGTYLYCGGSRRNVQPAYPECAKVGMIDPATGERWQIASNRVEEAAAAGWVVYGSRYSVNVHTGEMTKTGMKVHTVLYCDQLDCWASPGQ